MQDWRNQVVKLIQKAMLFFLLLCLMQSAGARWATEDDLDVVTESYDRTIEIHKDGTYVETIALTAAITKESGKDKLVSYPLIYNAVSSTVKVLEAKTILNGVEHPVDVKYLEDKPLASTLKGFDENRQILIAFPGVALNAKVYLKYQVIVKEIPVPGFFATDFIYGGDSYWKSARVQIASELPFYIEVNDPEKVLEINRKQINNKYQMDIILKRPIIKVVLDEQAMAFDGKLLPWVTLSTVQEWPKLGATLWDNYEAVLNQKLPMLFQKIAMEAKTKTTLIDKLNTITSRLSENITYMGDWRTIKGAYIPRALEEIVKTKTGDCKDFAASTVAILRYLGIKGNVAFVNRGILPLNSPNSLPNLGSFNHAIVYVKEGKETFWIDPTNFSSFAQGIYPDIAHRPALVLDALSPTLLYTSALDPNYSKVTLLRKLDLPKEEFGVTKVDCQISLTGVPALDAIGADLRFSKETINHLLLGAVTNESRVISWNISPYNLTSRIASTVQFNFDFTEKNTQMKTTAGNAFLLPTSFRIAKFLIKTEDRVTDLFLADPGIYSYETVLTKKSLMGNKNLSCHIDSPWLRGSRKIVDTKEGIKVLEEFLIKKDRILNTELQAKRYTEFQTKVFSCFGDTALIYKN